MTGRRIQYRTAQWPGYRWCGAGLLAMRGASSGLRRGLGLLLFLWVLMCLSASSAQAQRLFFRNYSLEQGLPASQVDAITQDPHGSLWLGTIGGGLARFDGFSFETFTTANGLPDDMISGLAGDRRGHLWIATRRGVGHYDGKRFTIPFVLRERCGSEATRLAITRQGGLLVASSDGVCLYQDGILRRLPLPSGRYRDVAVDGRGVVWAALRASGVVSWDGQRVRSYAEAEGVPSGQVYALLVDAGQKLWLGSDSGVRRLEGDRFQPVPGLEVLEHDLIRSIYQDKMGTLWFGTRTGVVRRGASGTERWTVDKGLSENYVRSIFQDREGTLWLGTNGGGVCQYVDSPFVLFGRQDGLNGEVARALVRDARGTLWIGTERGVTRYDGRSFRGMTAAEHYPESEVLSIFPEVDGTLWIVAQEGVFRMTEGGARLFTMADGLPSNYITDVARDGAGTLYVSSNAGLARLVGERFELVNHPILKHLACWSLLRSRDGGVWVGTYQGLFKVKDGQIQAIDLGRDSGDLAVEHVVEGPDGSVWLAAIGTGLIRYVPPASGQAPRTDFFETRDGLLNAGVVNVVVDAAGDVWAGHLKGVSRLDMARFRRTGEKVFTHYGPQEGYMGLESNSRAALADPDGTLWFGALKGLVRFAPRGEARSLLEPLTRITGLRLFLTRHDLAPFATQPPGADGLPGGLELPYDQNHLTLDFTGVNLAAPSGVAFSYRLAGLERTWSPPVRQTFATYSSLPAGRYTFELKARNQSGVWNRQPVTYTFVVRPPFWATAWFIGLGLFCLVALVLGIIRLRVRSLKAQGRRLEAEVALRTAELAQANRRLEDLAARDGLTGLANHRTFESHLEGRWNAACVRNAVSGPPGVMSLIMIDVDEFKRYNDHYGHPAGDQCLREVAQAIQRAVRRGQDLAARYGGEEFAVILPETDSEEALAVAERIRLEVESRRLPHGGRLSPPPIVTVSLGVAMLVPRHAADWALLKEQADNALYSAKHRGRNQVQVAPVDARLAEGA